MNWDFVIAETHEVFEQEFTDRISGFLSGADAAVISASLNPRSK